MTSSGRVQSPRMSSSLCLTLTLKGGNGGMAIPSNKTSGKLFVVVLLSMLLFTTTVMGHGNQRIALYLTNIYNCSKSLTLLTVMQHQLDVFLLHKSGGVLSQLSDLTPARKL